VDFASALAAGEGADWTPLVDASQLPIIAGFAEDDSILARSLRQVISSLDDPNGVISAFDSFAAGE
jgi:hypothetical protein